MRSLRRRSRHEQITPLEEELLAARPQPPERLVESIVAIVRRRPEARPARLRIAFAGGLTVTLIAVAGATGGLSYAASAIAHATHAVHLTSAKPSRSPVAAVSSACSQYAQAPIITGISPTSGKVGTHVVITGSHFSAPSAITSVLFDGTSASFTIDSDTQLTAIVPVGAHTGPITISNCPGSATSQTFTILKPSHKSYCIVPRVIHEPLGVAAARIRRAHCRIGALHYVVAPKRDRGRVRAEHPRPGTRLPRGSRVALTLGKTRHPYRPPTLSHRKP